MVEAQLGERLRNVEQVSDLRLAGEGDAVRIDATVVWRAVSARVGLELGEIRLRHRRLGFRIRKVHALGGVPVPRGAVERLLQRVDGGLVTVVRGQRIVVVDLSRWIPQELTLSVLTVQVTERSLHVWFGPGQMRDLPRSERKALEGGKSTVDGQRRVHS